MYELVDNIILVDLGPPILDNSSLRIEVGGLKKSLGTIANRLPSSNIIGHIKTSHGHIFDLELLVHSTEIVGAFVERLYTGR